MNRYDRFLFDDNSYWFPPEVEDAVMVESSPTQILESATHAPKGGATIARKKFKGGEFIPAADMAKATTAEKHDLKVKQEAADTPTKQPKQSTQKTREPAPDWAVSEYQRNLNILRDPNVRYPETKQRAHKTLDDLEARYDFAGKGLPQRDTKGNKLLFKGGPISRTSRIPPDEQADFERAWLNANDPGASIHQDEGRYPARRATETEKREAEAQLEKFKSKYGQAAEDLADRLQKRKDGPDSAADDRYRELYHDNLDENLSGSEIREMRDLEELYGEDAFSDAREQVDQEREARNQRYLEDSNEEPGLRPEIAALSDDPMSPEESEEIESQAHEFVASSLRSAGGQDKLYASLAGLGEDMDEAETYPSSVGKWKHAFGDDVRLQAYGTTFSVVHPNLDRCEEFLGVDKDGQRFLQVGLVIVKRPPAPPGFGATMFANQIQACEQLGVDYITLHAAGNPDSAKQPRGMNGYYTWPRFGFDQDIGTLNRYTALEAKLKFPKARTVLDIFETPGGPEWWKENGCEMLRAKFDMNPGSRSRRIFDAYLAAKSAKMKAGAGDK